MIITITPEAKFSLNYNRINYPAIHAYNGKKTFCGIEPLGNWTIHQMAMNYPQDEVNCKRCLRTKEWHESS
jgi:hypothetical protein